MFYKVFVLFFFYFFVLVQNFMQKRRCYKKWESEREWKVCYIVLRIHHIKYLRNEIQLQSLFYWFLPYFVFYTFGYNKFFIRNFSRSADWNLRKKWKILNNLNVEEMSIEVYFMELFKRNQLFLYDFP